MKRSANSGREQIVLIAVDIVKSIDRWLNGLLAPHKHTVTGFRSEMEPRLLRKPPTSA